MTDHTKAKAIARNRARELDLNIAKDDPELEPLLWDAYLGIESYLDLRRPYQPLETFMADQAGADSQCSGHGDTRTAKPGKSASDVRRSGSALGVPIRVCPELRTGGHDQRRGPHGLCADRFW